jgi:diguanylate cyclase (GGDEF)-like protein
MGGEEFLLVLVGADPSAATRQLDELRRAVAAHPWAELVDGLTVTISVGVASAVDVPDLAPADMLSRADAHLYRAKSQGRDQVVSDLS